METMNTEHYWSCDQCGDLTQECLLSSDGFVGQLTCPACTAETIREWEEADYILACEREFEEDTEMAAIHDDDDDYWGE